METKIYTVEEYKQLFLEGVINKSAGKVSKVSDNSVLGGVGYGIGKISQKTVKDIALVESEMFPDYAYGQYLDRVAMRTGVSSRQKDRGSSVWVKIVADPGTVYPVGGTTFASTGGFTFSLEETFVMGESGYDYVKLKSNDLGASTNVPANTINRVTPTPSGHKYVINEVPAEGGVDVESDDSLRNRILQNFNNFAFDTLDKIKSVFQTLNTNILDVKKIGINASGQSVLGVMTVNGVDLTEEEIDYLLSKSKFYLSLKEQTVTNGLDAGAPIEIKNIQATYVDMDFRVSYFSNINSDDLRVAIQEQVSQAFDFRNWTGTKVQWEDLFTIVRSQDGIKVLPEEYFTPHADIPIPSTSYPRLRGFIMRDLTGEVIVDNAGNINPIYYQDTTDNVLNHINTNYYE